MNKRIIGFKEQGYTVIENILDTDEIKAIIKLIEETDKEKETFRKTNELFAIRQFLKEIPAIKNILFNSKVKTIIRDLFGKDYFLVKSIYFDKPGSSNWFVSYHQDLTISVNRKIEINGFGPWTIKHNQFAVQPPLNILENNFTIRFHLDDTDENNGALKVIPGSHLKGVCRPETIDWSNETENICEVSKGGIMIMKPLLLHASNRTINNQKRRVIHLEFSDAQLPEPLMWSEKLSLN